MLRAAVHSPSNRQDYTSASDCYQMTVQVALWFTKRYPSTLISVSKPNFSTSSYQVATQLSSRGWVDPIPDTIGIVAYRTRDLLDGSQTF